MTPAHSFVRASLLGGATGIHVMTGPTVTSWSAMTGSLELDDTHLAILGNPDVAGIAVTMALGEIVADKLPFIPKRIAALPLLGRILAGALVGAAVFLSERRSGSIGAAVGAGAAGCGAFLGYRLRMALVQKVRLPNPLAGLVDDALAMSMARYAVRRVSR